MAVTQGLGDGFALYNGVKFPNIDSVWTDKETYPYAYICYHVKRNRYELYFAKKWASGLEPGIVYATPHSSYLYGFGIMNDAEVYYLSGDSWAFYTSHSATGPAANRMRNNSPTWSNVTIYADSSLSSIYFAATTPIPLDGMQVIEWNGDPSGLTVTDGGYAIVADFANAESAICSVTGGGETSVADDFQKGTVGNGIVWNVKVSGSDMNVVSASSVEYEISGNTIPAGIGIISAGTGTYILAYTPAAEPETPKWTFNLRDFLSGMASAAASRGVLRREPIAYLYNGVQLPGLPEVEGYALIYAVVGVSPTSYRLLIMDFIPEHQDYIHVSTTYDQAYGTGNYAVYSISNNEWVHTDDKTVTDGTFAKGRWKWSNVDLSDADGNVALAASDPVPVYGGDS